MNICETLNIHPYLSEKNLLEVLELIFKTPIQKQVRIPLTNKTAIVDYVFNLPHNDQEVFVEFNGHLHYTQTNTIERDYMLREHCVKNNIRLIEIPYFIQLNLYTIPQYFGKDIEAYLENVTITTSQESGFLEKKIVLPYDYCVLGLERFLNDLTPTSKVLCSTIEDTCIYEKTTQQIINSLKQRSENETGKLKLLIENLNTINLNNLKTIFGE